MRYGLIAVVAAALTAAVTSGQPAEKERLPTPPPQAHLVGRRMALRGEFPYLALVANMWGECTAVILSPRALLGPASCLPEGYPKNGRVDAGNNQFTSMRDYGERPSQGKVIQKFIKKPHQKPGADSLMIMNLVEPFHFTPFVHDITIAQDGRLPAVAPVVGYGLGSDDGPRRLLAVWDLQLIYCQPRSVASLCVAQPTRGCRVDHGAAVVADGQLVAIAGRESLCNGSVMLVAPHRVWIMNQLRIIHYRDKGFAPVGGGRVVAAAASGSPQRAPCTGWPAVALPPLAVSALRVCGRFV